jgi:hypothetical protein
MSTANVNGFLDSNTYVGQKSLNRTNPFANAQGINAEQLYGIDTFENRIPVSFTYGTSTAGNRLNFAPLTGVTSASDFYKVNVIDESGNEAQSNWQSSAPTAILNINTSALVKGNDWKVLFATATTAGLKTEFSFVIEDSLVMTNTSATISYPNL